MINVEGNLWIPSDGYKYITNGEVYTNSIRLGRTDSIDNWHDTNNEPPEPEAETHDALQLLWDNINKGQQKQLYKCEETRALLDRYGVEVEL